LGDADPTHPLASPRYAELRELPPLLIQVGEDETMLVMPQARRATERLARFLGREHPDRSDDLNCDGCE
jgi:acetyl esterase/lipase